MDNPINNIPVEVKTVSKKPFKNKKLFIITGIILLIIVSFLILFMSPIFNKKKIPNTASSGAEIQLKTEYENPFDEKTQYENPFSQEEYQNPFDFGQ